jgi:hypothetical protein
MDIILDRSTDDSDYLQQPATTAEEKKPIQKSMRGKRMELKTPHSTDSADSSNFGGQKKTIQSSKVVNVHDTSDDIFIRSSNI